MDAFYFQDMTIDEKINNYNDETKTELCRSNMVPAQEKAC